METLMSIDWTALKAAIEVPQRFVLTSHVRPDCDALGSELAMAAILRQMGKEVTIVNDSETPTHLEFIDPQAEIKQLGKDISREEVHSGFDGFMVLDTSACCCKVTSATRRSAIKRFNKRWTGWGTLIFS